MLCDDLEEPGMGWGERGFGWGEGFRWGRRVRPGWGGIREQERDMRMHMADSAYTLETPRHGKAIIAQ